MTQQRTMTKMMRTNKAPAATAMMMVSFWG